MYINIKNENDELRNCTFEKSDSWLIAIIHCLPNTWDIAVKGKTDPNKINIFDDSKNCSPNKIKIISLEKISSKINNVVPKNKNNAAADLIKFFALIKLFDEV